tara:strand:- start:5114 stop:5752 length:639 start_codon:yes stop_codon:yes gene_type:complete
MLLVRIAVAGDVVGDFSNGYDNSTVDSNNLESATTNNYNATGAGSAAPVMSAIAPTIMGAGGNDSCLMPLTTGIQVTMFGFSSGGAIQDESCNRRKNARLLGAPQQVGGLGLQVSAISILCQDPVVFRSMMLANTPCPINDSKTGKLLMGRAAIQKYRDSPALYIVGYILDIKFWDTLLRVGEEYTDEDAIEDTAPKLSLSQRFRSSKRTGD